jgi:tetratricopeptide (TPR) repeat protein/DNA-binding CsgD family transcriptional regulator
METATAETERLSALLALAEELRERDPREARVLATEGLERAERLKDQSATAKAMLLLGWMSSRGGDYNQALVELERALSLYQKLGDGTGVAKATGNIGSVHLRLGEYAKALEQYQSALALAEELGQHVDAANLTLNIGSIYKGLGDYARGLEQYQSALALFEGLGHSLGVAIVTGNIGGIYQELGEYARALEQYQSAIRLFEQVEDHADVAIVTGNIGAVYQELGHYADALKHYQSALHLYTELGERSGVATMTESIGSALQALGEYTDALNHYQSALTQYEELGEPTGIAIATGDIGWLYAQKEFEGCNASLAEEYLLRAVELMDGVGVKQSLYELHKRLARLCQQQEKWQEAHQHLMKEHELKEELHSIEVHRKVEQLAYLKQIAEIEKRRAVELAEAQAEREALGLRTQLLEVQLDRQRAELASQAMNLARQAEMLGDFRDGLRTIIRDGNDPIHVVKQFNEKLKELPSQEINWTKFDAEFRATYPEFQSKLVQRYPELTGMEMKVCALLKLKLTSADIAKVLCLSDRSVEGHRLRIRKKMGLAQGEDVHIVLAEI